MDVPHRIKIGNDLFIGPSERCFIIAEIGQNHQGDLNVAKQMILSARDSGADCVKFQKSHLPSKFNKEALLRPYEGFHSWGQTYGDHKKFLEFSDTDFIELQKFSEENNILFSSSAMDEESLKFLNSINLPFIKIGSGEFHNTQLISKAADLNKPLIISTGMSNENDVVKVYRLLKTKHLDFCLLHCVSSYPTPYEEINLKVITSYKKLFPDINIGYSGHEIGVDVAVAAVALGAKVIEKHFTLNKAWKGSDHACSLTPSEFKELVQNIRNLETGVNDKSNILQQKIIQEALGQDEKKFQNSEIACFNKLGKSVVAAVNLNKGDLITWDKICLKVAEPKGVYAKEAESIIGASVRRSIQVDESILKEDLIKKST